MRRTFNKAGYTATSCGRVGRSGNARFHTFQLMLTDGRTDGQTDGRTDKASYRNACPQLKMKLEILNFSFISKSASGKIFYLSTRWLRTDGPTNGRTKPLIELRVRN